MIELSWFEIPARSEVLALTSNTHWFYEQAAILQQTAEHIFALEQDKTRLLQQNTTLKRILSQCDREGTNSSDLKRSPPKKSKIDQEARAQEHSKDDENNNVLQSDDYVEEIQKELIELRCQLERERRLRISVEEKKRQLELDLADARSKSNDKSPKSLTTSRQNLDTIVQAIKHLEGDKPELLETPTKCKTEAVTNGPSSAENASRRLIVWNLVWKFTRMLNSPGTADWRGCGWCMQISHVCETHGIHAW